jgi:hypothetical protein
MAGKNDNNGKQLLPSPMHLANVEVTRPSNVDKTPETKKYSHMSYNTLQIRHDMQQDPVPEPL